MNTALARPSMVCDHILKIPEDILGRILFSGYLSTKWYYTVGYTLVSRKFQQIGRTYISHVCNLNRIEYDSKMRPTQLNVLGIQSVAQNVVFLDLSFTVLSYTQELGEMLMIMKCTLRGLSLRGSGSNDGFIGDFVSRLTQLKYLNVSQTKSDEKANITDDGARHLCALKQLKWLNISMTNITAASITSLQAAVPSLTHLDVYGCKLLSDEVVPALLRWKLRSVDLSNCPLLTTRAFEMICANTSAPLASSLENLACCYLPAVPSVRCLPLLLQLPKLRRLDFRKNRAEDVPPALSKQVRGQLEVTILQQQDQLRGLTSLSIIEAEPPLHALCTMFTWPYRAEEL